jgi:nucleoside-diphosphate-sugar epimerase
VQILVAGAAGYLGRSVVRACSKSGHTVHGLVRKPEQDDSVRASGGVPVRGDLLDAGSLSGATRGMDVVIQVAQAASGTWEERKAVRVDGTRHLVEAARRSRVPRFILGSGYWVYRGGPGVLTEDGPMEPMSVSLLNFGAEQAVRDRSAAQPVDWVILRPGMVYGLGSWFREMVDEIDAGRFRFVGDGSNFMSPVDLDDTGEAFRYACERGAAGESYLVVDDAPVTTAEFARFVAERRKAPPPSGIALDEAAREWGREIALLNAASRKASNAKLRRIGWSPGRATYREGVPRVLDAIPPYRGPSAR